MNGATHEVRRGDCLEVLKSMADNSIDAVVTDPPYGIGFMGHEWDQPGDYGPVKANGTPGVPFSGKPYPGEHTVGGRAGVPSGQRRATQPPPSDLARDGSAMQAGRYDLSATANRRFQDWCAAWAAECLRVLKPGGFLLSFGGSRTFHRLVCAVEDVGFEVRDRVVTMTGHELGPELQWLYGSGFPKSLNVSKRMEKAGEHEAAEQWDGWGTALKPAHEPIVVARKPLTERNVAGQFLATGTGGININATRVGDGGDDVVGRWPGNVALVHAPGCREVGTREVPTGTAVRRNLPPEGGSRGVVTIGPARQAGEDFSYAKDGAEEIPAWECAPGCPIAELDEQSGIMTGGAFPAARGSDKFRNVFSGFSGQDGLEERKMDGGGASRFMYCAKSAAAERDAGLHGFRLRGVFKDVMPDNPRCLSCGHDRIAREPGEPSCSCDMPEWAEGRDTGRANFHPTVKPIALMRWLVRLVAAPGATVLDPFAGSGTTLCAAVLEGVNVIGIERSDEYAEIAEARAKFWADVPADVPMEKAIARDIARRRVAEGGQGELDLFASG